MLDAVRPVRSLLVAIFVLMAGAGSISTLASVRLEAAGAGAPLIGLVGAAYFADLTLGSLRAPAMIRRVGHIRAFAAFVSLLSASTLAYVLHQGPALWLPLRLVDGICIAGVYVCLESWLNDRAEPRERGAVLGGYMISLYAGQAVGQFLLNVSDVSAARPFLLASILISLAVLPVTLTKSPGPTLGEFHALSLRRLYAASPLGLVGTAAAGLVLGAFYALGAVYARRIGLGLAEVAGFMSAVILGGVALQWPLGWLSDRFDRRAVIVWSLAGTVVTAAGLALAGAPGVLLLLGGGLFGGLSFALYPLCVAHTNDHLSPEQRVAASGGLVLVYSVGAAIGPLAGGAALAAFGAPGLFGAVAVFAAAAVAFGLWRLRVRPSPPEEAQQPYQPRPHTTPMAAALDPLSPEET